MDSAPTKTPAIRFHGKSQELAETILDAFRNAERLPAALAPIFIGRKNAIPCNGWSWGNRLLVSLRGHTDARGFRQWQQVGRHVRKGEQALYILSPVTRLARDEEHEEHVRIPVGFRATPVFGYAQTEGEPLSTGDPDSDAFLRSLPLREIAADWNIAVAAFNGRMGGALGSFSPGHIRLGVQNLATWCHELVHAADHRNGNLKEFGQHWRSETVAELGGAVLLKILGYDAEADLGGCWRYIASYAEAARIHPLTACQRVLTRTCDAVALILDSGERLQLTEPLSKGHSRRSPAWSHPFDSFFWENQSVEWHGIEFAVPAQPAANPSSTRFKIGEKEWTMHADASQTSPYWVLARLETAPAERNLMLALSFLAGGFVNRQNAPFF